MRRGISGALGALLGFAVTASITTGCLCIGSAPPMPTGVLHQLVNERSDVRPLYPDYQIVVSDDRTRIVESYSFEGTLHEVEYDVVRTSASN